MSDGAHAPPMTGQRMAGPPGGIVIASAATRRPGRGKNTYDAGRSMRRSVSICAVPLLMPDAFFSKVTSPVMRLAKKTRELLLFFSRATKFVIPGGLPELILEPCSPPRARRAIFTRRGENSRAFRPVSAERRRTSQFPV